MLQQRQVPQSPGKRGGRDRSLSTAFDSSTIIRVSLGVLCVGAIVTLPQGYLAGGLQVVSNTWTHLIAGAPSQTGSRRAETAVTAAPSPVLPVVPVVAQTTGSDAIIYGDRLKVTFFESVEVALGDGGHGTDPSVATVFPRMDLTGEYVVDEEGRLSVPKLGSFATTGQTITALESALGEAFKRAFGRTSDVHVVILERKPVYVLGGVRNAGVFKYTPGMIVLQAIADAGGSELGQTDTSRAIENIRETLHLRQGEDRLDRLVVRQARLIAQRDGLDTIALPTAIRAKMSETVDHNGLNGLVAEAVATLSIDRRSYQQVVSLADRRVDIARTELQAQNMRVTQLKTLLGKKANQLHDMGEIAARGSVSQFKMTDAAAQYSELEAREQDLHVSVAQAEGRLAEAEIARAKVELDHSAEINRELASIQQEIDESAQEVASIRAVTEVLQDSLSKVDVESADRAGFLITRRGPDGLMVIPANETTLLLPGDVLQAAPMTHHALAQR